MSNWAMNFAGGGLVAKSRPTLVTSWTVACQAPLSMGILQARMLEWVAIPFPRRIFPTQELNSGLLYCRQILYRLSYEGPCEAQCFYNWASMWIQYRFLKSGHHRDDF